ncbi:nicotinamide-nucleotide amidase [Vibrio sp. S4M6]|uniref:nicotinamide-nucleotide amidase n=1 Tax=Vibrio sinus TaxID=2946865 RepID=UPI00202AA47C|nr:nicotinamide-nucleotide amidase [Vibrio sinus]MCL9780986.1 nicotinamide-nucleotide amidase [Vibrio sinus]
MNSLLQLSHQSGQILLKNKLVLATAESCTGGGIASAITDIAGSSAWFDRAFVTYSNDAKTQMVGVKPQTLQAYGAVSEAVVTEMALGTLEHSQATTAISVSGIAGPGGATETKPVGTVCFAWADKSGWLHVETQYFTGDRASVREQSVRYALQVLNEHYLHDPIG